MLICVCSAVAGSSVQARRHDCLADGDVGHSDQFSEPERVEFPFEQPMDADTLVDRITSISFIAGLPPEQRAGVECRLRDIAAPLGAQFLYPYVTHVHTCHKLS